MSSSITPINLEAWVKGIRHAEAVKFAVPLAVACAEFEINTPKRISGFLGQIAHESSLFRVEEECLNYSAERLVQVWPSRFPTVSSAAPYARQPQRLANKVYANRMGNGDEASGDGWRYRGRGLIQITGRENYRECGKALVLALEADPNLLLVPEYSARAAGWFWNRIGGNRYADIEAWQDLTRKINGGVTGLSERVTLTEYALKGMLA